MTSSTVKKKSPRKGNSSDSGIVLLDVLFAVLILGIAAIYFVQSRSNAIADAGATARLRIARMLAGQKMEEVLVEEVSQEENTAFTLDGNFEEEGYKSFEYEIDVEDVSISTEDDLEDPDRREWFVRRVTVTVTYPGEMNTQETFSLTTILPEIVEEEEGG